jgi:phosphate transport system protein
MERKLHHSLDSVKQNLVRMGSEVERMIDDSMRSLVERDNALAEEVRRHDEEIDSLEKSIDEACFTILATQQPTAVDLRFLVAVMKITNDLERIGDSAVNITKSVLRINTEPPLKPYIDLPAMSDTAARMMHDSLEALVNRDSDLALDVCRRDQKLDDLYKQLFRELLTFMIEKPETVSRALHLLLVARNLERIGDHATNVAEDVIYYVDGRDIRHEAGAHSADTKTG